MKGGSQILLSSSSLDDSTGVVKDTVVEGSERGTEGEVCEFTSEFSAAVSL